MRLIDADELLDSLKEWDDSTGTANSMRALIHATIWTVMDMVDDQPTAYSVDKVVEELEGLAKLHARHQLKCEAKGMDYCADRHEHKVHALDEAIAIVKRGGRHEK